MIKLDFAKVAPYVSVCSKLNYRINDTTKFAH